MRSDPANPGSPEWVHMGRRSVGITRSCASLVTELCLPGCVHLTYKHFFWFNIVAKPLLRFSKKDKKHPTRPWIYTYSSGQGWENLCLTLALLDSFPWLLPDLCWTCKFSPRWPFASRRKLSKDEAGEWLCSHQQHKVINEGEPG